MAGGGGSTAGEGGGEGQEAAVEFAVSFEDVLVNVRQNGERVRVLGPATGCVRSGQVLSVVGPAYEAGVMASFQPTTQSMLFSRCLDSGSAFFTPFTCSDTRCS